MKNSIIIPKDKEQQLLDNQVIFGKEVVKRREALGFTQKQFVLDSRISQKLVSDVELGKANLTMRIQLKFTNALYTNLGRHYRNKGFNMH